MQCNNGKICYKRLTGGEGASLQTCTSPAFSSQNALLLALEPVATNYRHASHKVTIASPSFDDGSVGPDATLEAFGRNQK